MYTPNLSFSSNTPLYRLLYLTIRKDILTKELPSGSCLPAKRKMAANLGISINTVDAAYQQLVSEGYLLSRPQSGFFVKDISETLSGSYSFEEKKENTPPSLPVTSDYFIDFSPNGIDLTQIPVSSLRKTLKKEMDNPASFSLSPSTGALRLREGLCRYLRASRGLRCTPEQILVGAGTDYLLQLLVQILRTYQNTLSIAMEDPVYSKAYQIFSGLSIPMSFVPLEDAGLDMSILKSLDANVVYTTPSHQFPLGYVMPVDRRLSLLRWAKQKRERFIIEDDYDSEFRYFGKPVPAISSLDDTEKVIYLGTFSKNISPSVRVSYLVLPKELMDVYNTALSYYGNTVTHFEQLLLAGMIENGEFERHINRTRTLCKKKRDFLLTSLLPYEKNILVRGTDAGMHVLCTVKNNMSERELTEKAKEKGIRVYGISDYYADAHKYDIPYQNIPESTILLGYAGLTFQTIQEGVEALGKAWLLPKTRFSKNHL